jgi:4-hydroxymandelate oxidase
MGDEQAKDLMEGFCRVCRICNGKICAGEVPGMGGVGTGSSFRANLDALARIKFNMKVLKCTKIPSTNTNLLGLDLDIPVLAAPVGGVSSHMSKKVTEEEYIKSLIEGCYSQNTIGCIGDGPHEYVYKSGYKAIKAVNGNGIPFIKPWNDKLFFKKIEEAKEIGAKIIGIDMDSIGIGNLVESIPLRTAKELKEFINKIPFQVILKGIMTSEEAQIAVEMGSAAIVVSNHGGRVLDYTRGTAEVLPDIVKHVNGKIPVLVDGGIRSGADVLKMLALGADAVMIGRPIVISVFKDLKNGVGNYLKQIKKELVKSMLLTGCEKVCDINSNILV